MSKKTDTVVINLDRPRELRLGYKAMKRWMSASGKSIAEMDTSKMDMADIELLLFYLMQSDADAHNETLKIEDIEDLLDQAKSIGEIYDKIGESLDAAFPENKEKNATRATATN